MKLGKKIKKYQMCQRIQLKNVSSLVPSDQGGRMDYPYVDLNFKVGFDWIMVEY
jgi:hypothetical protein